MVDFSMISRYERAESNMGIDTLRQIAAALGCSASYLLEGVEPTLSTKEEELIKVFASLKDDSVRDLALAQMKLLLNM